MPPAAAIAQSDRVAPKTPTMLMAANHYSHHSGGVKVDPTSGEGFAKDAIIAWFRGEFAAANAIIDALCTHLKQVDSGEGSGGYDSVFASIHRRRMNWIPILQMQKYYSIADVAVELRKATLSKQIERESAAAAVKITPQKVDEEKVTFVVAPISPATVEKDKSSDTSVSESSETPEELPTAENGHERDQDHENGNGDVVDDSPESEITDTGSQGVQFSLENVDICSNHEGCEARRDRIKITKGFIAREPHKGHMLNVVRGLKLYEDIFTDDEITKLNDFATELRVAGQNGELSGGSCDP